jgi:hypothetical protein
MVFWIEKDMKKLLIIGGVLAAGEAFAEVAMPAGLTFTSKVAFNTASVSNGRHTMGENIVPSLGISIPLFDGAGKLYFAEEGTFKVKSGDQHGGNDACSIVGFSYNVTDLLTIDVGYDWDYDIEGDTEISTVNGKKFTVTQNGQKMYRSVPDGQGGTKQEEVGSVNAKRSFHEVYAGLTSNMLLNPGLYCKYDMTQQKFKAEIAIGHTFHFNSSGFAIEVGAKLGYVDIQKPNGVNAEVIFIDGAAAANAANAANGPIAKLYDKKDWCYVGGNADLAYNFNEHAKVYAGVEAIWNSAPKDCWVNSSYGQKHKIWFTAGTEFSF